jgi:hypothetical protein
MLYEIKFSKMNVDTRFINAQSLQEIKDLIKQIFNEEGNDFNKSEIQKNLVYSLRERLQSRHKVVNKLSRAEDKLTRLETILTTIDKPYKIKRTRFYILCCKEKIDDLKSELDKIDEKMALLSISLHEFRKKVAG